MNDRRYGVSSDGEQAFIIGESTNFCSELCRMAHGCLVRRVDGYLRLEKEDR
jgi:hypothetical protein